MKMMAQNKEIQFNRKKEQKNLASLNKDMMVVSELSKLPGFHPINVGFQFFWFFNVAVQFTTGSLFYRKNDSTNNVLFRDFPRQVLLPENVGFLFY